MKSDSARNKTILFEIKAEALLLQHNMSSHLLGEALYAQMEYERLVDRFRDGFRSRCSDAEYETAKQNFDTFMRLLDAAIAQEADVSDISVKS